MVGRGGVQGFLLTPPSVLLSLEVRSRGALAARLWGDPCSNLETEAALT